MIYVNHHNIVCDFEFILCPVVQGYKKGVKVNEVLKQWLNKMKRYGFNIFIVSEAFSDISSHETEDRVKWLHDNDIEYDMLIPSINEPKEYFYFIRRFESSDLIICENISDFKFKFTGIDFNLTR